MRGEPPLREGDIVELLHGAPVPAHQALRPGAQGRIIVADAPTDYDPSEEVTVLFESHGRAVRLHRRWLRWARTPRPGRPRHRR